MILLSLSLGKPAIQGLLSLSVEGGQIGKGIGQDLPSFYVEGGRVGKSVGQGLPDLTDGLSIGGGHSGIIESACLIITLPDMADYR